MHIRPVTDKDHKALWRIMEPIIRGGETYALPRDLTEAAALAYWMSDQHDVFVAEDKGEILGTYYIRANQRGGGSHVANCGYMTGAWATGRGVARTMCAHSLDYARSKKFRAIQFNLVISTNERAIKLWQKFDFEIVARLKEAFQHPHYGFIDAFVMYRLL